MQPSSPLVFCFAVLIVCLLCAIPLHAHPTAEGSVDLRLIPDGARVTLRVSNEQVFVAGTLGEGAKPAGNFDELLAEHGTYIQRHFHLLAEGEALAGTVEEIRPPQDRSVSGFTSYVLRFPIAAGKKPRAIELRQDLLTEILYAPGNPWEAPLIVQAWSDDRPILSGALLTAKQPVVIPLPQGITAEFSQAAPTGYGRLAGDFFRHGMLHIAGGIEHALFVAALAVVLARFGSLFAVVTTFTVAHTLTLTLAVLGAIHVRSSTVQPLVDVTIVLAALFTVLYPERLLLGPRLGLAFTFGLLHGLGFAGGLSAAMTGFGPGALAAVLASFSLGVESGHLLVVIPVFAIMFLLRRHSPRWVPGVARAAGLVSLTGGLCLLLGAMRHS